MTIETTNVGRHAHGAVKGAVHDYVREMPPGREFWYGDVAEELGLHQASVSGILRKMRDEPNPVIKAARVSGRYVRISQEPLAKAEMGKGDLLEVVAVFKDGRLLLSSQDGKVWEAAQV